eukprot:TRINITY_DN1788_c0_g1_i1.p1 TRINITY_DN1788_c0_g1~~TRINITY_DN1788_c0_g1_i1.p1  ORF type:complete len:218 (-),score=41.56 TRINITY_DN1788_c0_g1_i1:434-1087(-)
MFAVLLLFAHSASANVSPPVWDAAFVAPFHEVLVASNQPSTPVSVNDGIWFYDSANDRAKFVHGTGQQNNFCSCSQYNTSASCELLFVPNGYLWAIFPDLGKCCHLCDSAEGCSAVKRDWLRNPSVAYKGKQEISGTQCDVWCEPGAVAEDCWAYTSEDNVPCAYIETFAGQVNYTHTLQFYRSAYKRVDSFEASDPAFELPEYCTDACALQFPSCG